MNVGRVRSGFWLEGVSTSLYSTFSSLAKTVCLVDDTQWMGSWQCSIYTCHVTSSGSLLKHLDRCHPSSHRLCSFQLCQVKVAAAHSRNLHLFDVSKTWTESFAYVRGWKKLKTIRNIIITVCHFEWHACWHQDTTFSFYYISQVSH